MHTETILAGMERSLRAAGELMLGAGDIEAGITAKPGDRNYVTAYDLAVQRLLAADFARLLPEAVFVGEEGGTAALPARGLGFLVDPIDGTTNFICDYRASVVSAALCRDGIPLIGAVYDPYRDEMYTAYAGGGAYCNGQRLLPADRSLRDSLVGFGTCPYERENAPRTFALTQELFLHSRDVRRSGAAAMDLCHVAAGRLGVFFEMILRPWDYAAGVCILREALCQITTMEGGPVDLFAPCSILAGAPTAHEEALIICQKGA